MCFLLFCIEHIIRCCRSSLYHLRINYKLKQYCACVVFPCRVLCVISPSCLGFLVFHIGIKKPLSKLDNYFDLRLKFLLALSCSKCCLMLLLVVMLYLRVASVNSVCASVFGFLHLDVYCISNGEYMHDERLFIITWIHMLQRFITV